MKKGYMSIPELVKWIHFDINKPQNHNIYISHLRDNNAMVFDGIDWSLRDRKSTIDDMYDDKSYILINKYDEIRDSLDEKTIKKFNRFVNNKDSIEEKEFVLNHIKLLLYNKKKIPLKTKRTYSKQL